MTLTLQTYCMVSFYFETTDKQNFEIKREILKLIGAFNFYLEEIDTEYNSELVIKVQVESKTLKSIIVFCEMFISNPMSEIKKPLISNVMNENVDAKKK